MKARALENILNTTGQYYELFDLSYFLLFQAITPMRARYKINKITVQNEPNP